MKFSAVSSFVPLLGLRDCPLTLDLVIRGVVEVVADTVVLAGLMLWTTLGGGGGGGGLQLGWRSSLVSAPLRSMVDLLQATVTDTTVHMLVTV